MNTRRMIHVAALFALVLSSLATTAALQGPSPFVGEWQAVDADGGAMRLTIGGPPAGPFHITWQEGYFGYCAGEAGIARGTGTLDPTDPYVLNGELLLECLTGANFPLPMNPTWHYDPAAETITAYGGEGETNTVWHRPGHPPLPPDWLIIGRPADEGVDGGHFPEGTVVRVLVMDDGHSVRWSGTDTAVYPEWDPDHTWVTYELDIDLMAGDHVWMYDGTNAKELVVTPLEITGVDLLSLTVNGMAEPGSQVFVNIEPDTMETSADASGQWSVSFDNSQLGQGVTAYQEDEDGDLTLVGTEIPRPRIVASAEGNWFWTSEFPPGTELTWNLTVGDDRCDPPAICQGAAISDESGFINVGLEMDLRPEDVLTVTAGATAKVLDIEEITIDIFDLDEGYMAGAAGPEGRPVYVVASPSSDASDQHTMDVNADEGDRWIADFDDAFVDPGDWQMWSFAQMFDDDGDVNEAVVPPTADFVAAFADISLVWEEGTYSYSYSYSYEFPEHGEEETDPIVFTSEPGGYSGDGFVLLRPGAVRAAVEGGGDGGCPPLDSPVLSPYQPTRFVWGGLTRYAMTYEAAVTHFETATAWVEWDDGESSTQLDLDLVQILEWPGVDPWMEYVCSTFASPVGP